MLPKPDFSTQHAHIRLIAATDATELLDYYRRNRTHLAAWEPSRSDDFYSQENMLTLILAAEGDFYAGKAIKLGAFAHTDGRLIASIDFSHIVRGPMQACYLGYSIDAQHQGRGLMREFLPPCLQFIFHTLDLHRVQASYMIDNHRSGQLLAHLGFVQEGLAKQYLHINGQWQDHILTAKINPSDGV
jgi:ribosomal-protein-alanine N-acetyltransferase